MSNALRRKTRKVEKNIQTFKTLESVAEGTYDKGFERGFIEGYTRCENKYKDSNAKSFMFSVAITIKVMHEQYGYGHKRLAVLVNKILDEYNATEMSLDEINAWLWEYAGFKLEDTEDDATENNNKK